MSATDDLLYAFEAHSPDRIRKALDAGADPTAAIRGDRPIDILIEMYTRSPRFAECLRVMLDRGARINDPLLEAVLLDDPDRLPNPAQARDRRLTLRSPYTSMTDVSPLHVCAEYNSIRCARALLQAGADVNARAGVDPSGVGGHTPVYHSVNSNQNLCRPVMELLVESGADLDIRVNALVWGRGFEWETIVYDVSPISYAQCGLYFQFHRREADIYGNIAFLYRKRHGTEAPIHNVPNRYLNDSRVYPPRT